MATVNPAPPPDGYYWFQPTDPGREERVVHVRHSLDGTYAQVAPAPWHPPQPGAGLHITGGDLVLLSMVLRCFRLGMKPAVHSMNVYHEAHQLQNRLDQEHRAQIKARRRT